MVMVEATLGECGKYQMVAMASIVFSSLLKLSQPSTHTYFLPVSSYLVTNLMGADLNNIVKFQRLSDEHVQFLIYQLLRGLKVNACIIIHLLNANV